ncbi:MAG: hypothetical protein KGY54_03190 [Oleiphilaceae bacterium]|nr:hypothetical protein [Oleiphilaceae bacterium]
MNEHEKEPEQDPREAPFVVDTDLLTQEQLDGLVDEYCTRFHGTNETELPLSERDRVMTAVRRGDLVVWFDPVENNAGLDHKPG